MSRIDRLFSDGDLCSQFRLQQGKPFELIQRKTLEVARSNRSGEILLSHLVMGLILSDTNAGERLRAAMKEESVDVDRIGELLMLDNIRGELQGGRTLPHSKLVEQIFRRANYLRREDLLETQTMSIIQATAEVIPDMCQRELSPARHIIQAVQFQLIHDLEAAA